MTRKRPHAESASKKSSSASLGEFAVRTDEARYESSPRPPRNRNFSEEAEPFRSSGLADVVHHALDGALAGNRTDFAILDELLQHGFSREEIFDLVVTRRTFARRKQANDPLSSEETDRAVRLARITAHAERVFGDDEKAHRWLRKPSRTLEGTAPLSLLKSETGAHLVEQTLYRIEFGMLA